MAFPVSSRTTGTLITQSIWNSDIVDNLNYLKGLAGAVLIEDDLSLDAGHVFSADRIFAGGAMYAVHKGTLREVVVNWEDNVNVGGGSGGGGNQNLAGAGQYLLYVDDDNAGSNAYIDGNNAAANSKDISFNASRSPYGRFEFNLDSLKACQSIFIGFRTTPDGSIPYAENHAGLVLAASTYSTRVSSGGAPTAHGVTPAPTINQRHVVEILINAGTSVLFYVDGTLVYTHTSNLPTGALHWTALLYSDGAGGVGAHSYLTLGKIICQEALA